MIKSDDVKIVLNNPQNIDGKLYLIASKETTSQWKSGSYKYQIINDEYIESSGQIEIMKNYLLTDEYETVKSHNELMLDAITAQIEGRATAAQQSMTVGDKSISYCTIEELFTLKSYFEKLVAEEQGESVVDGNELKIKYRWSLR